MTAEPPSPSLKDLEARLGALRASAGLEREGEKETGGRADAPSQGMGMAFRVGVELVAGVAVGGGIGWFLDGWLGTRPFLMIGFFVLGAAAGMLNVYRMTQRLDAASGAEDRDAANGAGKENDGRSA
ncbi:MAG: AtpZ/AtpI family protein [Rhodospirillales bacterium]